MDKMKVAIVTGANTGIGLETSRGLAKLGYRVILACRSQERAEAAREDIIQTTGNNSVEVKQLDLGSFQSVREFATDINKSFDRIDLLVNNAGVFMRERALTQDGHEMTFGVNYLGPFLLTYLLLDKLKASTPSRIVNVASESHRHKGEVDLGDLMQEKKAYNSWAAYGASKTANILHAVYLAEELKDSGVTTYSLHPGTVDTEITRDFSCCCYKYLFRFLVCVSCMKCLTPVEGAATTLYCATDPSIEKQSGRYYENSTEAVAEDYAMNTAAAKQLWEVSLILCSLNSRTDQI